MSVRSAGFAKISASTSCSRLITSGSVPLGKGRHVTAAQNQTSRPFWVSVFAVGPGVAMSAVVAIIAYLVVPYVARFVPIPGMVIALSLGILLNPIAARRAMQPGMAFCVHTVLRWAVALLGLRVGLAEIVALGLGTASLIVISMMATLAAGFLFAYWSGRTPGFGALIGAGTAVCGASATLAVSTVVPNYAGKQADIAFVVVAVNAFATIGMVIYPPLCAFLHLDQTATGVMLGGTIHDVAQVVGAGYAVSETVGNTAVVVKLFRVFLLLPVVLGVGWYLGRFGQQQGEARVPMPVFAFVFLALCTLNSAVLLAPALLPAYAPIKDVLVEASTWGLLLAIGALGLGTSIKTIAGLGWRHITSVLGSTVVILLIVTAGLTLMRFL
jgi:uncharacterized integral membrane protein (TIGR00698 family)